MDTMRWWIHFNPTLCKRICSNLLQVLHVVGMLKFQARVRVFVPRQLGETFTNYFELL